MDEIPNDTFKGCKSLREIIIPQSIKKIGNNSFSGCTSLNAITIPKSVKEVGENCFEGCISLKQVVIDLFYTNIEKSTFKGCLQLQDIITRKRKTENMKSSSLSEERIIISSKQTEILFDENILESSYFLSSISEFKEIIFEIRYPTESFERIYRLINKLKKTDPKTIKICIFISGIETTDTHFCGNKDIDMIKLDSSIKTIEGDFYKGSFSNCSSIIQISIPSSVTTIGSSAFSDCSSLKQISIPSSITSIEGSIFNGCTNLENMQVIPNQKERLRFIEEKFLISKSLKQISIPSSVTSIGSYAFSHCSSLKQISIPSSVTSIGSDAFNDCSSLIQISIPSSINNTKSLGLSSRTNLLANDK
ncbi:hypothetical protein M9Y10_040537 [Tritrichomonas musculus]|uniref:Surface antigen BspA-like n=1 Tax=Tritrichomonas musculus TaxID=1915356 RepID=A0ABR2GP90_9EUKA